MPRKFPVYMSGAQKRKIQKERDIRHNDEAGNYAKLTTFFSSADQALEESQSSKETNSEENLGQTSTSIAAPLDESPALTIPDISIPAFDSNRNSDPALWEVLSQSDVDYWISQGPSLCQNQNASLENSRRLITGTDSNYRYFTKNHFHGFFSNGEKSFREWLLYSPSIGKVYCFPCKLMKVGKSKLSLDGFDDWSNATKVLQHHENSHDHRKSVVDFELRARQSKNLINHSINSQMKTEVTYWRNVLQRVVEVIKFVTERGLAFRGENEMIGSPNNGNILGILELISKFDPFLADHLSRFGNKGRGIPSYVSSTVYDELIELMAETLRKNICESVNQAKYFSFTVDSTPDISHQDQMTFTIRYVDSLGAPVERFLQFVVLESHHSENIYEIILSIFTKLHIDIKNCRGQSYDNASNMSGRYSGLQARIKSINPYAAYIPCVGHSLNLVGASSVRCCTEAIKLFDFIQEIYNFASSSTKRWTILMNGIKSTEQQKILSLKSLSDTRWHSHYEAIRAIDMNYSKFYDALCNLGENTEETMETRQKANSLAKQMRTLETAIMFDLWRVILNRFHKSSISLQSEEINLGESCAIYKSLLQFVADLRDRFAEFEDQAKIKMADIIQEYATNYNRTKKRKILFDDSKEPDTVFIGSENFRIKTFLPIIDNLQQQLSFRETVYSDLQEKFSCLFHLSSDTSLSKSSVQKLLSSYPDDFSSDSDDVYDEFEQFRGFSIDSNGNCEDNCEKKPKEVMEYFAKHKTIANVFKNVEIAVRIYLSMAVSVCNAERSFSTLSRIKNCRRSTMSNSRLSDLTILSMESDLVRDMSFDEVIDKFSTKKARKKCLS